MRTAIAAGVCALAAATTAVPSASPAEARGTVSYPIVIVWGEMDRAKGTAAGDLYVVGGAGRQARPLVRFGSYGRDGKPYGAFTARWSPDRSSIGVSLAVYFSDPGSQVAVVSSTGRNLRSLTGSWTRQFVSWTADGAALIHGPFWQSGGPFQSVPLDGGRSTKLRIAGSSNRRLSGWDWSHHGSRIAAALDGRGIVTMDSDGRGVTRITRGNHLGPMWSPSGGSILFTRVRDSGQGEIYVVRADGSGLRKVASGPGLFAEDWSPDGRKILFLRDAPVAGRPNEVSVELWAMNSDGSGQARLPFNRPGWWVLSADWSR